jgi:hypothetical protein
MYGLDCLLYFGHKHVFVRSTLSPEYINVWVRSPPDIEDSCEFVEIIISRETVLVPNTSTFVQITLAAVAQPTERQFLLEEHRTRTRRAGIRRLAISKREGHNLEPR